MTMKHVVGFEGYLVDEHGNVFRYKAGKLRLRKASNRGAARRLYPFVHLVKDGVCHPKLISHIVLEAFVGPKPSADMQALHRDDNQFNNCVSNLYWGTRSQNAIDKVRLGKCVGHVNQKLTCAAVRELRARLAGGERGRDLAKAYGLAESTVSQIKSRKLWPHV